MSEIKFKNFSLGTVVATPGALEAVSRERLSECLKRHASGDWGCIDSNDVAANNVATHEGSRILSAYAIDPTKPCKGYGDNCLWIITDCAYAEAEGEEETRHATTALLPDEY